MNIEDFKQFFDSQLERYLRDKLKECRKIINDPLLLDLIEQGTKIAQGNGKRLRPYVCYSTYVTCGGRDSKKIMPILLALELVHTFGLIHDDIMDESEKRHGVPTVHHHALQLLKKDRRRSDVRRVAQSHAILVGDIVLSWAAECIMRVASDVPQVALQFNSLMNELILGQMLDVDFATRSSVSTAEINKRIVLKTARYSFAQPMLFGSLIAGNTDQKMSRFCLRFGESVGIGFQIQDDILDIVGDAKKMHKPVLGDLRERQHTFLTQFIFEHGTTAQQKQLRSFFGKPLQQSDQSRVVKLFQSSGALEYGQQLAEKHFAQAEAVLQNMTMDMSSREVWAGLIAIVRNRTS